MRKYSVSEKKSNKIPSISPERVDQSPANTSVGSTKEEQVAHAFVKGKEAVQPFTVRLPVGLYGELRELAFKDKTKINHIVIRLIRDYVKSKTGRLSSER
jgi:hypothetical protein